MALETKRAAVNTAADTLIAAWKDLCDGITPGEAEAGKLRILLPKTIADVAGAGLTDPTFSTTKSLQNHVIIKRIAGTPGVSNYIWEYPCQHCGAPIPLFFKMTNNSGEIS